MIDVPVYMIDEEDEERSELLGLPSNADAFLILHHFRDSSIDGYYTDTVVHTQTKTIDIVLLISGSAYRTPYSSRLENKLKALL